MKQTFLKDKLAFPPIADIVQLSLPVYIVYTAPTAQ